MAKEEKTKRLALDSSVAVYILPGASADKDVLKRKKANMLFREKKYEFVMPTPVISEILSAVPVKQRDDVKNLIYKNFDILDFHAPAAEFAAKIFNSKGQIEQKQQETKARVKFDAQIIGICASWNIESLCSFDKSQCDRYNRLMREIGKSSNKHAGPPDDFIKHTLLLQSLDDK